MISFVWNLLFFAIALGILVTVHEAGHFFAARMCGVKVLRFSIGFGNVLFKKTGKDGCEYAVSLIPLGGYVKMKGENEDDTGDDSYKSKNVLQKAIIIAAGPLANIFLSCLLYFFVSIIGVSVIKPVIGDVIPDSYAQQAGLTSGSIITKINDEQMRSWSDVLMTFSTLTGDGKCSIETDSFEGMGSSIKTTLKVPEFNDNYAQLALEKVGLRMMLGRTSDSLGTVLQGSPAQIAGIEPGDKIVSVNGQKTPNWYRVYDAIRATDGSKIALLVERGGQIYETSVLPNTVYNKITRENVPQIGVGAKITPMSELEDEVSYSVVDAVPRALSETYRMSTLVVKAVIKMISGAISAENISGPISIAKGAGASATGGVAVFLSFLAAISVNLGILNLLPVPILDGGQLMFIAYEAVFRRAPGQKVQRFLTAFGLGILLFLMMLAVFNDIRGL